LYLAGQHPEGFALSIVEAMACGVVPLRTPSAGAADQIKHGANGYIFPFWDFETLGKQLVELFQDEQLREKLAKGALHTAKARFSGTAMAKATMKVLSARDRISFEKIIVLPTAQPNGLSAIFVVSRHHFGLVHDFYGFRSSWNEAKIEIVRNLSRWKDYGCPCL
jgi:Glycosyl transferases group 1